MHNKTYQKLINSRASTLSRHRKIAVNLLHTPELYEQMYNLAAKNRSWFIFQYDESGSHAYGLDEPHQTQSISGQMIYKLLLPLANIFINWRILRVQQPALIRWWWWWWSQRFHSLHIGWMHKMLNIMFDAKICAQQHYVYKSKRESKTTTTVAANATTANPFVVSNNS